MNRLLTAVFGILVARLPIERMTSTSGQASPESRSDGFHSEGLVPFPDPPAPSCTFTAPWSIAFTANQTAFEPLVVDPAVPEVGVFRAKVSPSSDRAEIVFAQGGTLSLASFGSGLYCGTVPFQNLVGGYSATAPFHNFVGYLDVFQGATRLIRQNIFANILDPSIPSVAVTRLADDAQASPRLVNLFRPNSLSGPTTSSSISTMFYSMFGDHFDFLNIVFWPDRVENRTHVTVRNDVTGNGSAIVDNGAAYGSPTLFASRLKGINRFPITGFFDLGETGAVHEIGHQWLAYLDLPGIPLLGQARPHWPPSSLAYSVMGFNIPGSNVGGTFSYTVTSPGGGQGLMQTATPAREFTIMDLYLMGLASAAEAGTHLVFTDPAQQICNGCTGPVVSFTSAEVIAAHGPRYGQFSQTQFHAASILVSMLRPLTVREMRYFDHMAARGDALTPLQFSSGFSSGQTLPFYLATKTRARLSTFLGLSNVVNDGTGSLAAPVVTKPVFFEVANVTGAAFIWTSIAGATGYDLRVSDGATGALRFSGSILGSLSPSTLISLTEGDYTFAVRACSGGFSAANCGPYGTVFFTVRPFTPTGIPAVTFPVQGATLTSSTQTLSWAAAVPQPESYEVLLRDLTAGTTALQITVPSSNLATIFTMRSSTQYELKVRACAAACGSYSPAVTFAVTLPPIPVLAPSGVSCTVSGGNSLTCNWNSVVNADAYQVQVVQAPPAGPGGGALTAAARQVSATTVTLPVPSGAATVFIAACNGNGCGPNATTGITAAGPNPSQANLGTPMAGTVVAGPGVLFTWNRIPGDNESNTTYRLFVQDLSRQATALDVFTTSNFYSAYFKAEGARYDALVISNPGLPNQSTGPAQGFNVAGSSATSPTLVSPPHNSRVSPGNIQLGWSPVPGATLYEYFVAVLGQGSASARGVTPGLLAQVPLTSSIAGTVYSGIVRACPAGAQCMPGSDAGWGPWSNAAGGPGVTNFTVIP